MNRSADHPRSPDRQPYVTGWNFVVLIVALAFLFSTPQQAHAQAGLREALEALDTNQNGVIEVGEITPLSRPYLERVLKTDRRSIDKDRSISRIMEYVRIHYAIKNGVSGKDVQPTPENRVKGFGPDPDKPIVPGFGLGRIKYPYKQEDLDEADETLGRYDKNGDGLISRAEAMRSRWTHRNPFDDDINKDDQLSKMELTQRYARRRLLEEDVDELRQKAKRVGKDLEASRKRRTDDSQWWRQGGSSFWLTASLMGRFDANRNGRLEVEETASLGIPASKLDLDGDGEILRDELFPLIKLMQDKAGDMTVGLPGWFYEVDENRDKQVSLAEFAAVSRRLSEFRLLDVNGDGLLTVKEASAAESIVGGNYRNERAEVLPPQRTIISEIDIEDDFLVGDLDVMVSITHSHVGHLDAFLTSPDGQRVELFSEVGGGGDHFENTIFDDQSPVPITKAKPPFKGKFRSKGPERNQPGLNAFNDKSVKGVWQLVVRGTRSDRFGMLHSWSLNVTPKDDIPQRTKQDADDEDKSPGDEDRAAKPEKKKMGSIFDQISNFAAGGDADGERRGKRQDGDREARRAENARRKAEWKEQQARRRSEAAQKDGNGPAKKKTKKKDN
jgi:subtilisin-like proprotein convertase family protein/Ca2+-binding EF-hand superfamily protein